MFFWSVSSVVLLLVSYQNTRIWEFVTDDRDIPPPLHNIIKTGMARNGWGKKTRNFIHRHAPLHFLGVHIIIIIGHGNTRPATGNQRDVLVIRHVFRQTKARCEKVVKYGIPAPTPTPRHNEIVKLCPSSSNTKCSRQYMIHSWTYCSMSRDYYHPLAWPHPPTPWEGEGGRRFVTHSWSPPDQSRD